MAEYLTKERVNNAFTDTCQVFGMLLIVVLLLSLFFPTFIRSLEQSKLLLIGLFIALVIRNIVWPRQVKTQ